MSRNRTISDDDRPIMSATLPPCRAPTEAPRWRHAFRSRNRWGGLCESTHRLAHGRINWRALSEKVDLSLTPTLRRVRRLEENGFILSYVAMLDEKRLGSMSGFVSVTLERRWDWAPRNRG
jgi:Winged helix-turn-helix DNA-binding